MTDPTLPSTTAAVIIREPRTCGSCGSTATVDITRVEQITDYEDTWVCPVCHANNSEYVDDQTDVDEVDPDSWHDAMHEED